MRLEDLRVSCKTQSYLNGNLEKKAHFFGAVRICEACNWKKECKCLIEQKRKNVKGNLESQKSLFFYAS